MAAKLSYKDWLAKSGRQSSKGSATAWARWAGKPAPRGKVAPDPRRRGPGAGTPPYMGYAGAVDPSFGGTPLSTPADAAMAWTGASNPDLAEIARGGWTNLTPKKRPGGGWDVYGNMADPTPQWGKDYLSDLRSREQRHTQYVDQQVSPWLANVLGSAQTVNSQAQVGLANQMAQVNTQAANAAPGGAAPVGMTGAGSGAGMGSDLAGGANAQTQAGARIGSGAYDAALSNLTMGTSADAQAAGLAQSRLRLPGQYEQMRMDFSEKLGQITESIKENQRAREFQRQQLLESRRQYGLTFAEQKRSARAGEDIQRGALDLQERGQDWEEDPENPANTPEAGDIDPTDSFRTLTQIRQNLDAGERLVDNNGQGWTTKPKIARFHGKPVSWERAKNGQWYGVAGTNKDNAGSSDGESGEDYRGRYRDYVGRLPELFAGKGRWKDNPDGSRAWQADPGTKKSLIDVATDMLDVQDFRPADAVRALMPTLRKMNPDLRWQRMRQIGAIIRPKIPMKNKAQQAAAVANVAKWFGVDRERAYDILRIGPGNA